MNALATLPALASRPEATQADNDAQVIAMWLHGRTGHTRRAYEGGIAKFTAAVPQAIGTVTIGQLQAFADSLEAAGLATASQVRTLATVKSLFGYATKIGYLRFNAAAALRLPKVRGTLAARIITEEAAHAIMAAAPTGRDKVLVRVLYAAGLRVSEACGLRQCDAVQRGDAGQVTVHGKGGKTRTVLLSAATWKELAPMAAAASGLEAPIFTGRDGAAISTTQAWRIVRAAAKRAGIEAAVSPHWLRHGHASHSLDRGAPVSLVAETLGHASVATTSRYLHARPDDSSARYLAI